MNKAFNRKVKIKPVNTIKHKELLLYKESLLMFQRVLGVKPCDVIIKDSVSIKDHHLGEEVSGLISSGEIVFS